MDGTEVGKHYSHPNMEYYKVEAVGCRVFREGLTVLMTARYLQYRLTPKPSSGRFPHFSRSRVIEKPPYYQLTLADSFGRRRAYTLRALPS